MHPWAIHWTRLFLRPPTYVRFSRSRPIILVGSIGESAHAMRGRYSLHSTQRIDVSSFYFERRVSATELTSLGCIARPSATNQRFPPDNSQIEAKRSPATRCLSLTPAAWWLLGGTGLATVPIGFRKPFVQRRGVLAKLSRNLDGPSFVDAMLAPSE